MQNTSPNVQGPHYVHCCGNSSFLLNTITCKDGNSVPRELLSLMKTVVVPIAALCQVPSTCLLLSHLHNQDLTFIEHLLVPGTRLVLCVLSHGFPTTPQCRYYTLPSHPGGSGVQEGRAICSRSVLHKAESIASATSAPHSVSCLHQGS